MRRTYNTAISQHNASPHQERVTKPTECHARLAVRPQRSGSTLLVVIALMGMLALLGLMFFTFASQEQASAKNYLESAKHITDPELGPDVYFDWALRQAIRGANRNERQSALGAHLSLLAGAYGHDAHPHSGKGIDLVNDRTTIQDSNGDGLTAYVDVDLDGDGTPDMIDVDGDGIHDFLEINRSVAANVLNPGGGIPVPGFPNEFFEHQPERFPEPDVDYTYPDINNAFLANISRIWVTESPDADGNGSFDIDEDFNGNGIVDPAPYQITVIKPSYWRPELLTRLETSAGALNDEDANLDGVWDPQTEDANGNNVYDTTDFNGNGDQSQADDGFARLDPTWYWQPWSRSLILRPHPLHFYIPPVPRQIPGLPPPPPAAPPSEKRFLFETDPNDAAIIASLPGGSKGFPFAGPRDVSTGDTIALREGVWRGWRQAPDAALSVAQYEFDADADNDGIREAILLDLGFPAQQRPSDGALYVPMFAMTIYDADGLINLNTAGNLAGDTFDPVPAGGIFGDSQALGVTQIPEVSISKSHHGLTPFEINPGWALNAIPIDAGAPSADQTVDVTTTTDYSTYFGRAPLGNGDIANRWELANMEMWWLNKGRIEYGGAVPDIHEGRMGDASRVWLVLGQGGSPISVNDPFTTVTFGTQTFAMSNLFPFPGDFGTDDNRDANYGGAGNYSSGGTYAFGQPLSVTGRGSFIVGPATGTASDPTALDMGPTGGGRMKWLRYSNYDVAGTPTWRANLTFQQRTGQLFAVPESAPGANDGYLVDDMTEMIIEPRSARRPSDEILSVADSAGLHLSKTDGDLVGIRSRATELMPGNLNPSDASVEGNERRRRFTTSSWDRKQFNFPFVARLAPGDSPGEDGVDDDRNGIIDDATEIGWPNTNDIRAWEFNVDIDGDQNFEFPPQFLTVSPAKGVAAWSGHAQGLFPQIPQDPFRPQVRRILNVERGNRDELKLQFRLSINGILDVIRTGDNGGHAVVSPLEYRPLTPHTRSNTITSGDLPTTLGPGDKLPVLSTNSPEDQEFWARYDRQRLARDIYVLLYTLCGGEDNRDYTTLPGATLYTTRQLAEMAQFAVNLVDQLDPDNVMTIFEYDTDLSDGWDLDDMPWTNGGLESDRQVVAGVEQQQLTISETLWVRQLELANDNPHTAFDESMAPAGAGGGMAAYHFADIELLNASPETVELAAGPLTTNAATAVWRLRWTNETNIANIPTVNYQNNIPMGENGVFFLDGAGSVGAGGIFSIGSSTNIDPDSSDLFVNTDGVIADFERVAPRVGPGASVVMNNTTAASPNTDLDLIHTGHDSRFDLGNGIKTNGDFISRDTEPTTSTPTLILERRADPELPQLNVNENPWVVVDYTAMTRREFVAPGIAAMGPPSEAETLTALQGLRSTERNQPLQGETEDPNSSGGNVRNSVNAINSSSPGTFDLLQPHFDRDFASIIELLLLPVREPRQLTRSIVRGDQGPTDQYSGGNLVPYTAASKILVPNNPNGAVQWDNHWHRLLSLVEVPTRMHRQLGNDFQTTRVPGKINLNTMRHAHVLAALLDDPLVHGEVNRTNGRLPSLPGIHTAIIDWWGDFLRSRDGEHPDFPGTGFSLPGHVASNPFRDLGHMDDIAAGDNPVEDTILRTHPDTPNPTGGGLFDINTSGNGNQLLRRQLLGKLMNNTTTRSNVFFVFIHVQFHEAIEDATTGAVRVGGRIDLNGDGRRDDGHRGFFTVDRSAAEDAYDPRTGTFDWKQLVKHRVTIN